MITSAGPWAPFPSAARFDRRTGIHHWADNSYDIGAEQYAFVATNDFGNEQIESCVIPRDRNLTIVHETTNVTNTIYNNKTVIDQGPDYDQRSALTNGPRTWRFAELHACLTSSLNF